MERRKAAVKPEKEQCHCREKHSEEAQRQLQNRLNRMIGQLNGMKKMLDENRYCGDILIQIAAVERALQSFGYIILKDHMETCVVEGVKNGDLAVVDEAVELMKKLK
jgi:DNA-binding FrmR family transcriptional regulator